MNINLSTPISPNAVYVSESDFKLPNDTCVIDAVDYRLTNIKYKESTIPTNCKNCCAPLPKIKFGNVQCEYCHTNYY